MIFYVLDVVAYLILAVGVWKACCWVVDYGDQ